LEERKHIKLSNASVWRAARAAGLKPYHRPRKPLLTDDFRKRCLDFVRLYGDTDWRHVLFTDEKTFELFGHPNRQNDVVWDEGPQNVVPSATVKHPAKVHVWAGMSYYGITQPYLFEETLVSSLYITILEARLPAVPDLFPNQTWMLQQDGDPKHTSKMTVAWFDQNVPSYIPKEHWPPNSGDLNLMENLWSITHDRVYAREPRTLAALKRVIKEEWSAIEPDLLHRLVDSMPRRFAAVVAAQGGPTKY
jgi:hypothetical protein